MLGVSNDREDRYVHKTQGGNTETQAHRRPRAAWMGQVGAPPQGLPQAASGTGPRAEAPCPRGQGSRKAQAGQDPAPQTPGSRWRLLKCMRKSWPSDGPLRPRCCHWHHRLGHCHAPPTRGGPAPAGCGCAPPWPAPPSGPTRGRAPAPRSRAAPRAPARSCGTAAAALNPASRAGPADPCRERGGTVVTVRTRHAHRYGVRGED